jgi:hypothetical protein
VELVFPSGERRPDLGLPLVIDGNRHFGSILELEDQTGLTEPVFAHDTAFGVDALNILPFQMMNRAEKTRANRNLTCGDLSVPFRVVIKNDRNNRDHAEDAEVK